MGKNQGKKNKPQVINNIQELNLEIDYDKLAEAIVKAQNVAKEESQPTEKIGFWKAVGQTIINKEAKNGKRTAILSGDVAIGEYKEGYILDFDHNLSLLRYTLQAGEAERMRTVLSDDAIYYSEWTNDTYKGKDAIIDRFNYVHTRNSIANKYIQAINIILYDRFALD